MSSHIETAYQGDRKYSKVTVSWNEDQVLSSSDVNLHTSMSQVDSGPGSRPTSPPPAPISPRGDADNPFTAEDGQTGPEQYPTSVTAQGSVSGTYQVTHGSTTQLSTATGSSSQYKTQSQHKGSESSTTVTGERREEYGSSSRRPDPSRKGHGQGDRSREEFFYMMERSGQGEDRRGHDRHHGHRSHGGGDRHQHRGTDRHSRYYTDNWNGMPYHQGYYYGDGYDGVTPAPGLHEGNLDYVGTDDGIIRAYGNEDGQKAVGSKVISKDNSGEDDIPLEEHFQKCAKVFIIFTTYNII